MMRSGSAGMARNLIRRVICVAAEEISWRVQDRGGAARIENRVSHPASMTSSRDDFLPQ
jgi:hypothetical protein